jgi:hypothetical protein
MKRFKTTLAGITLALPLVALNAARPVDAAPAVERAAPQVGIEAGAASQTTCCWIFHMGRWYCIEYC